MDQKLPVGDTAGDLGADWVRLWGTWENARAESGFSTTLPYIEDLAAKTREAKARGVKVLMIIHRTPAWATGGKPATSPPDDPAKFGEFMGEMAGRIPAVDAWELWNEEDEPEFWLGGRATGRVCGAGQSRLPGHQGGAAERHRRHRRHHRQQLRLHRGALRAGHQGLLRCRRRPHRTPPAWSTVPTSTTATSRARSVATRSPDTARSTR